ncbi:pentapeptide repeat-containing protein [Lacrimispora amygdalina]|uniref:pentapeptide repeat-containing protein n=1 Tax=Lacrimispora amygdalina TaxID=253257 RepID=UPI001FA8863A|nr:pentapeptide repeat-containing protein [Lacrimispora amygdalina]
MLQKSMYSENKKCPSVLLGKNFQSKNFSGLDLSTKLLIAANFNTCVFDGTIFLGADTRDTDFSNANLRDAVFLSQGQINAAKGNRNTKLPLYLDYPLTWR